MSVVVGGKPHVGDVGTRFQLQVFETNTAGVNSAVDMATTTAIQILFTSSVGVEKGPFTATVLNPPGTDGVIQYINTDPLLIDVDGLWFCRARITFSPTEIFDSDDADIEVLGKIN